MCAESTATVIVRGDHRGTVRQSSAHNEQRPQPEVQKQRREWPQEQATPSHTAGIVQPCCHFSTGRKPTPRCRQGITAEHCANTYVFVLEEQKRSVLLPVLRLSVRIILSVALVCACMAGMVSSGACVPCGQCGAHM
ncbi:hypothetical protein TcCL_ESM11701 [Trypanosoma cruzi]|nr:hypothetical protein TcCL_ESM11701 [Trypanosoma cruzi]